MTECTHTDFAAQVVVNRITGAVGRLAHTMADVMISCATCGKPFHFVGVPVGLSFTEPSRDVPGTTLCAPIAAGAMQSADWTQRPGWPAWAARHGRQCGATLSQCVDRNEHRRGPQQ